MPASIRKLCCSAVLAIALIGCSGSQVVDESEVDEQPATTQPRVASKVRNLWPGDSGNWNPTNFGGEGEVEFLDDEIQMTAGDPLTGVNWVGDSLPTDHYEISLEAKKTEGNDFFCGLTFPVGDTHCSLILGGWGGSLVGLSCIDGDDASNNGTKQFRQFETDQWYRIKVFVDETGIEVKLDDQVIIDQARGEYEFSVRNETLPCRPLGICNFQTSSSLRNIVLKDLGESTVSESTDGQ